MLGLLSAVLLVPLLAAPAAGATEAYDLRPYGTKCVSGQTDERQYTYLVCHDEKLENYLRVLDPAGALVTLLRMPGANDVAPAPDGSYVYVSGGGQTPLRRFDRAANGTFAQNRAWVPPTFVWEGRTYPAKGRQIATDGYGNLYIANGMWTDELLHVVTKFAPDGRSLAVFGGFENTWAAGTFFSLSGISVSRDGRHLYTTEVHNSRVQRFDLRADGAYGYATMWGNDAASDPDRVGMCVPTKFAAPYDLAVDAWGDVWVASASCTHVQKFDENGVFTFGSFVGNRGTTRPGMMPDDQQRLHNIAADARGNLIAGETSNWLARTDPVPPWPVLDAVPAPAPVDIARTVDDRD